MGRRCMKLPRLCAAVVLVIAVLSACSARGAGVAGTGGAGKATNTATFALPAAVTPNWIWPFAAVQDMGVQNIAFLQQLMYRPLYWFGDSNGGPAVNSSLSIAQLPTFSPDGKTVTIKLKPYTWSNGEEVTAQDVVFWMNMEKAEKQNDGAYVPGQFPDNITSVRTPDASTIVLTTSEAYSQQWFTYNELGQITPMPTAWDVTGPGHAGTCATSTAGCAAVFSYLTAQAKDLPHYATNPLWQVVDGPWKLKSFNSDGHVTFVPNLSYAGPVKPTLAQFNETPYTSEAAEFNVLRGGKAIDVGYIPPQDLSGPKPAGAAPAAAGPNPISGYTLAPEYLYSINFFPLNYNNPQVGPIFKQLYFRQALQSVVDQNAIIHAASAGYGVPTNGPIPLYPASDLISSLEKANPYPFSLSAASDYLTSNGWKVVPNGTTTCVRPGTGAGECGAGIAAGRALTFDLQYYSGQQTVATAMASLKSNAAQVGITLNISGAPFNTLTGTAVPCHGSGCTWQMENWGGGWNFAPDYYPTGETLFLTGAGVNVGSYSNPAIDKLIQATNHDSGTAVMQAYEDALARDLPVIWQPDYPYQLTEIAGGLKGVTPQNPFATLTPENWRWSK